MLSVTVRRVPKGADLNASLVQCCMDEGTGSIGNN